MAEHLRSQIRDFAKGASVLGNLTTSGSRVYTDRVTPLNDTELGAGALVIWCGSEPDPEIVTLNPRKYVHQMPLHVDCYQKSTGDFAQLLDRMEKEVDVKILADRTMGGLTKDVVKGGSELEKDGDAEKPAAVRRLTFIVEYQVLETSPDQAAP